MELATQDKHEEPPFRSKCKKGALGAKRFSPTCKTRFASDGKKQSLFSRR